MPKFVRFAFQLLLPVAVVMGGAIGLGAVVHWLFPAIDWAIGTILAGQTFLAIGMGFVFVTLAMVLERLPANSKSANQEEFHDKDDAENELTENEIERLSDAIVNSLIARSAGRSAESPNFSRRQLRR